MDQTTKLSTLNDSETRTLESGKKSSFKLKRWQKEEEEVKATFIVSEPDKLTKLIND